MIRHSFGSTCTSLVWASANRLLFAARVVTPVIYVAWLLLSPSTAAAEVQYVVKPVAEMKVKRTSERPAVLADREFSDAGAREGRCR